MTDAYSTNKVTRFINSVDHDVSKRYTEYWASIKPKDHYEYYLRWLFAFCSIHTSWQANVKAYLALKDLTEGTFTQADVARLCRNTGVGLSGMRAQGVFEFHNRFWDDPTRFYPKPDERLPTCRDRLGGSTYGIGPTKTSFVLEMAFPEICDVVCLDTHILRLYGYYKYNVKGVPKPETYAAMEKHWVKRCKARSVPSAIARHIYWDRVQGFPSTRYWSWCLESA